MKELALYIEDQIKAGNWLFNLGLREDLYNGLTDCQSERSLALELDTTSSPPALF